MARANEFRKGLAGGRGWGLRKGAHARLFDSYAPQTPRALTPFASLGPSPAHGRGAYNQYGHIGRTLPNLASCRGWLKGLPNIERPIFPGDEKTMTVREPILHPTPISELRPTQMTVGMREVKAKREAWRKKAQESKGKDGKDKDRGGEFLGQHMVPVILGPKGHYYVIDHHHLVRALHDEGQKSVLVTVVANLKRLDAEAFWFVLDNRNWMHPFDDQGRRRDYQDIPKAFEDLADDPFRSLAGELRRQGGFAKDTTPFSEFLWADFLRRRMKRKLVDADFDAALEQAVTLAKGEEADYLPGWCGPVAR